MSSSPKPELRMDWCSHAAAKYAVDHWHYSRNMPKSKNAYVGAWEGGRFVGALVFGLGGGAATDGRRWGLARHFQVAELERVALTEHRTEVSRMIAIAMGLLRRQSPGLRLVISYADPGQGHHGGIYQAGGWAYVGLSSRDHAYRDRTGKMWHSRVVGTGARKQYGKKKAEPVRVQECQRVELPRKHVYLYPLDPDIRARILPLTKPYPKRPKDQAPAPTGLGGETPTRPLQHPDA